MRLGFDASTDFADYTDFRICEIREIGGGISIRSVEMVIFSDPIGWSSFEKVVFIAPEGKMGFR